MPGGGLTTRGPRNLLRQIREAMAGAAPAQERLDTVVRIIAQSIVAEVCSIYLRRASGELELFATQGLKPVTVEKRDLFRRPLTAQELKVYDAVVFDPPRAGAEAQVRELARAGVKKVAAVSCNPLTLARDLRLLVDQGYEIRSVTPVDQFLWSPHVEAVALLHR